MFCLFEGERKLKPLKKLNSSKKWLHFASLNISMNYFGGSLAALITLLLHVENVF